MTLVRRGAIMHVISYQTVDAEITAGKPSQRIRDAEIRIRNHLSNGPRRAQSNVKTEYSATDRHTSAAGDMLVS